MSITFPVSRDNVRYEKIDGTPEMYGVCAKIRINDAYELTQRYNRYMKPAYGDTPQGLTEGAWSAHRLHEDSDPTMLGIWPTLSDALVAVNYDYCYRAGVLSTKCEQLRRQLDAEKAA